LAGAALCRYASTRIRSLWGGVLRA